MDKRKGVEKLGDKDKSLLRSSLVITDENVIIDELISNSIDAKSTQIVITIDIKCHSITVVDNGHGISFENIQRIGPRYYSNKGLAYPKNDKKRNKNKNSKSNQQNNSNINTYNIDPTQGITSLGYRGEALASIAQVSLLEILTHPNPQEDDNPNNVNHSDQTRCVYHKIIRGGDALHFGEKEHSKHPAYGTKVVVQDLFYNLPVRLKMLNEKRSTKKNYGFKHSVLEIKTHIIKWCIAYPDIAFVLLKREKKSDEPKITFTTQNATQPKYIMAHVIDPELKGYFYDISFTFDPNGGRKQQQEQMPNKKKTLKMRRKILNHNYNSNNNNSNVIRLRSEEEVRKINSNIIPRGLRMSEANNETNISGIMADCSKFKARNDCIIQISGVIGDARRLYHNKKWQFLFLNRRTIKHRKIQKTILDYLMKIHNIFKYELHTNCQKEKEDMNIDLERNGNSKIMNNNRNPWRKKKTNKHLTHPIYALFISMDANNVIMESDLNKTHILFRNENDVIAAVSEALKKFARNVYPSLRIHPSFASEFGEEESDHDGDDDDDNDSNEKEKSKNDENESKILNRFVCETSTEASSCITNHRKLSNCDDDGESEDEHENEQNNSNNNELEMEIENDVEVNSDGEKDGMNNDVNNDVNNDMGFSDGGFSGVNDVDDEDHHVDFVDDDRSENDNVLGMVAHKSDVSNEEQDGADDQDDLFDDGEFEVDRERSNEMSNSGAPSCDHSSKNDKNDRHYGHNERSRSRSRSLSGSRLPHGSRSLGRDRDRNSPPPIGRSNGRSNYDDDDMNDLLFETEESSIKSKSHRESNRSKRRQHSNSDKRDRLSKEKKKKTQGGLLSYFEHETVQNSTKLEDEEGQMIKDTRFDIDYFDDGDDYQHQEHKEYKRRKEKRKRQLTRKKDKHKDKTQRELEENTKHRHKHKREQSKSGKSGNGVDNLTVTDETDFVINNLGSLSYNNSNSNQGSNFGDFSLGDEEFNFDNYSDDENKELKSKHKVKLRSNLKSKSRTRSHHSDRAGKRSGRKRKREEREWSDDNEFDQEYLNGDSVTVACNDDINEFIARVDNDQTNNNNDDDDFLNTHGGSRFDCTKDRRKKHKQRTRLTRHIHRTNDLNILENNHKHRKKREDDLDLDELNDINELQEFEKTKGLKNEDADFHKLINGFHDGDYGNDGDTVFDSLPVNKPKHRDRSRKKDRDRDSEWLDSLKENDSYSYSENENENENRDNNNRECFDENENSILNNSTYDGHSFKSKSKSKSTLESKSNSNSPLKRPPRKRRRISKKTYDKQKPSDESSLVSHLQSYVDNDNDTDNGIDYRLSESAQVNINQDQELNVLQHGDKEQDNYDNVSVMLTNINENDDLGTVISNNVENHFENQENCDDIENSINKYQDDDIDEERKQKKKKRKRMEFIATTPFVRKNKYDHVFPEDLSASTCTKPSDGHSNGGNENINENENAIVSAANHSEHIPKLAIIHGFSTSENDSDSESETDKEYTDADTCIAVANKKKGKENERYDHDEERSNVNLNALSMDNRYESNKNEGEQENEQFNHFQFSEVIEQEQEYQYQYEQKIENFGMNSKSYDADVNTDANKLNENCDFGDNGQNMLRVGQPFENNSNNINEKYNYNNNNNSNSNGNSNGSSNIENISIDNTLLDSGYLDKNAWQPSSRPSQRSQQGQMEIGVMNDDHYNVFSVNANDNNTQYLPNGDIHIDPTPTEAPTHILEKRAGLLSGVGMDANQSKELEAMAKPFENNANNFNLNTGILKKKPDVEMAINGNKNKEKKKHSSKKTKLRVRNAMRALKKRRKQRDENDNSTVSEYMNHLDEFCKSLSLEQSQSHTSSVEMEEKQQNPPSMCINISNASRQNNQFFATQHKGNCDCCSHGYGHHSNSNSNNNNNSNQGNMHDCKNDNSNNDSSMITTTFKMSTNSLSASNDTNINCPNSDKEHKNGDGSMDIIDEEVNIRDIIKQMENEKVVYDKNMAQFSRAMNIPIQRSFNDGEDVKIRKKDLSKLRLFGIGQLNNEFIISRLNNYIILIDQHAIDERQRLERLESFVLDSFGNPQSHRFEKLRLTPPITVYLNDREFQTLEKCQDWIKKWGFEWNILDNKNESNESNEKETNSNKEKQNDCDMDSILKQSEQLRGLRGTAPTAIRILQIPLIYGSTIVADELREMLVEMIENGFDCNELENDNMQQRKRAFIPKAVKRILASRSCKAAIKFGDKLLPDDMKKLLRDLSQCKLPYQCAHGRPTLFPVLDIDSVMPYVDE